MMHCVSVRFTLHRSDKYEENISGSAMSDRSKKLGPRVTVSVTPGDYDTLNAIAEKDDVSVSWVVRRAIQEYLLRDQPGAHAARRLPLGKQPPEPERK